MTGADPEDFLIHEQAPTDEEGHPIHPEDGYRICGAEKSDRTTPTSHGRERDEYAYCLLRAGWGTDSNIGACTNHPYRGSQFGRQNPSYKNGAFSEHLMSDLSERERRAYRDLVARLDDPEDALDAIREQAAEAYLKYKRSGDQRFLREYRQLVDTFNLAPNEDTVAVGGAVKTTGEFAVDITHHRVTEDDE